MDRALASLGDGFTAAALEEASWLVALRALAEATGSAHGQLIGLGGPEAVAFNWATDFPQKAFSHFVEIDGGNPSINPRIAAAAGAAPLQTIGQDQYDAFATAMANDAYAEYSEMWDIPFGCQSTLIARPGLMIGLAMLRSKSDGRVRADQWELFSRAVHPVHAAARLRIALEGQGAALLANSLGEMSVAAIVCDGRGWVGAMTPRAEALVGVGQLLTVNRGHLRATHARNQAVLDSALARAFSSSESAVKPSMNPIVLRSNQPHGSPIIADIHILPRRDWSFGFLPRVIITIRSPRSAVADTIRQAFDLSPAESEIAADLAVGLSRATISSRRGVAVGTVQAQIKSVFGKLGVTREAELIAKINRLL